jgi:hypothetical protein
VEWENKLVKMMTVKKRDIEEFFFVSLLIISSFFFLQEYFYIIIPDHKPFWIDGIPLTIIGIIGLGIFMIWYILRGKDSDKPTKS